MHIEDLPFPQRVVDIIRKEAQEFNPVQKATLPHVLAGRNILEVVITRMKNVKQIIALSCVPEKAGRSRKKRVCF